MSTLLLLLAVLVPGVQNPPSDLAVLKANLGGDCSADFTVKDSSDKAVYAASIKVRVRYGAFGVKRADLEIGTGSDGKARIEGLPAKARPLMYSIEKDGHQAMVQQDVAQTCHAMFAVSLK